MEKFTKLGLSKDVTDVLKDFKFKEPSEIQEKAKEFVKSTPCLDSLLIIKEEKI